MAASSNPGRRRSEFARTIAWLVLIIWAVFWTYFNIASGISESGEMDSTSLALHLTMPIAILLLLLISWRWEMWGGLLLVTASLFAYFFYHIGDPSRSPVLGLMLVATLIVPATASGMLLILCGMESWRGAKTSS